MLAPTGNGAAAFDGMKIVRGEALFAVMVRPSSVIERV
jgi:hypothetical protein